jgi:nickel-type superoxide dismutase maturation protease
MPRLLRRPGGGDSAAPSWFAALVQGPSMAPTLRHGDAVVVRGRPRRVRAGDVLVVTFPTRPGQLFVKRAAHPVPGGWWVLGDNPLASDDSRSYGPAEVVGRVVLRYWPRPGRPGPPPTPR